MLLPTVRLEAGTGEARSVQKEAHRLVRKVWQIPAGFPELEEDCTVDSSGSWPASMRALASEAPEPVEPGLAGLVW